MRKLSRFFEGLLIAAAFAYIAFLILLTFGGSYLLRNPEEPSPDLILVFRNWLADGMSLIGVVVLFIVVTLLGFWLMLSKPEQSS